MNSFWSLLDFCPCHSTKPLFGVAFAQERPGTDTSRRAGVTDSMGICGNNRHFCHLLILSPAWLQGAATQTTGRLRCCAETWVLRWDWNAPRCRGWGELRVRAERGDGWWHLPTSSGTARDATSPSVPRSENLPFSAFFPSGERRKILNRRPQFCRLGCVTWDKLSPRQRRRDVLCKLELCLCVWQRTRREVM